MDVDPLARLRHELRTPLNHIIGYSELLIEELEGGTHGGLVIELRRVREGAHTLLKRITDLLSLPHAAETPVELGRLRAQLGSPLQHLAAEAEALRARARATVADQLLGDVDRISAAVEELRGLLARPDAGQPAETSDGTSAPDRAGPPRGEILVVDDNDGNRALLARHLQRQHYRVRLAANGREALAAVRAQPTDLVLLDVMMPDMNGFEVLERLKADPALRAIPVLMISAVDELDSVVRAIELGAEDYLSKPFEPVLLRARVGACLEKKQLRDREAKHLAEVVALNRTLERRVQEQLAHVERLERLRRFFSPRLAELIVAGGAEDPLRSHRREIVVAFLDLRGFTGFAETEEPEEVMRLLHAFHAAMGTLVLEHEGTLERFTGDGMMIFFNDPQPVPNPAERAIRMAVAMREQLRELGADWRRRGHELGLGIGIAQGYATIGAIGYEGRWDYGAIGTVVNLAARLCGEAQAGQILVSQRVLGSVDELIAAESVGQLTLKGFSKPIAAFSVLALRS